MLPRLPDVRVSVNVLNYGRSPAHTSRRQLAETVSALMNTSQIMELHVTRHDMQIVVCVPDDVTPMLLKRIRDKYTKVANDAWEAAQ